LQRAYLCGIKPGNALAYAASNQAARLPMRHQTKQRAYLCGIKPSSAPTYAASNRATRLPMHFNPREMRSGQKKTGARPV